MKGILSFGVLEDLWYDRKKKTFSLMHTMQRSAHGCGKMTYEHSRLAKKVKKGKRPKRMKSADGSLFRLIFLEIRLGTYILMRRCTKVIKHCACAMKCASLRC
jgi:hypothetical protein